MHICKKIKKTNYSSFNNIQKHIKRMHICKKTNQTLYSARATAAQSTRNAATRHYSTRTPCTARAPRAALHTPRSLAQLKLSTKYYK
jgi:hypothetical protein